MPLCQALAAQTPWMGAPDRLLSTAAMRARNRGMLLQPPPVCT